MSELTWLDLSIKHPTLEYPTLRQNVIFARVNVTLHHRCRLHKPLEFFFWQDQRVSDEALGVVFSRIPSSHIFGPSGLSDGRTRCFAVYDIESGVLSC